MEDAFDRTPAVITDETIASHFLAHLGAGTQDVFPVIDPGRSLLGVLMVADLARISRDDRDRHHELLAGEVAQPTETLAAGDSLLEAMRRMGARGAAALPAVDRESGRLAGLLSRSDVLGRYGRILAGAPGTAADDGDGSAVGASRGTVWGGPR